MEPTDLKPNRPEDAQLEAWLRTSASLPPLPDDGFSARVMAGLPPQAARRHRPPARALLCVAGALAGVALVLRQVPEILEIPSHFEALAPALDHAAAQLANPAVPVALGVAAASLLFAFWREIRLLPRL